MTMMIINISNSPSLYQLFLGALPTQRWDYLCIPEFPFVPSSSIQIRIPEFPGNSALPRKPILHNQKQPWAAQESQNSSLAVAPPFGTSLIMAATSHRHKQLFLWLHPAGVYY